MRTYKDKEELKNEINKSFEKYISEFDNIPESLKDKRIIEVDRTPAENLAYQVGWTTLVLKWEDDEKQGIEVKTPSDMFKWNQLGELYQWFTDTYSYLSLAELKDRLKENITSIHTMIDSMSDEELFQPHIYAYFFIWKRAAKNNLIFARHLWYITYPKSYNARGACRNTKSRYSNSDY